MAADKGHVDAVNLLVELGGTNELDRRTQNNSTPFIIAAMFGQVAVLRAMHAKGGNLDQQNEDGNFPIHLAAWKGHVETVKVLVSFDGVQMLSNKNNAGKTPLDMAQSDEMRKLLKQLNWQRVTT
mmetsp:Transcript_7740/g.19005  ORF Transcript_7740/g.19005 Transcript_7740/m.19005 type:complete len:125 (-) Transcript_7740:915-1289(-)